MVCENGSGTQLMRAAIIEAADATPVVASFRGLSLVRARCL